MRLYIADVAARLGIRESTLRGYVVRGKFPGPAGVDLLDGHWRPWWTPAQVEEWMSQPRRRRRRRDT